MGSFDAGKTAIWVLIYFICMGFLLLILNQISIAYDLDFIQPSNSDLQNITAGLDIIDSGECGSPRYYAEADGWVESEEIRNYQCDRTRGAIDEDICNELQGCSWDNDTWLWWDNACDGSVNKTYYNNNISVGILDQTCNMALLQVNATLCDYFACTWYDAGDIERSLTFTSTIEMFTSLFTFELSFGFENQEINNLLILLLLYLPLVILGVSIYFILPFTNS